MASIAGDKVSSIFGHYSWNIKITDETDNTLRQPAHICDGFSLSHNAIYSLIQVCSHTLVILKVNSSAGVLTFENTDNSSTKSKTFFIFDSFCY